jgi:integrase
MRPPIGFDRRGKMSGQNVGGVYRMNSGKWLAKVPVGVYPRGGTRYKTSTFGKKAEATKAHAEMLAVRQLRFGSLERIRFRNFADYYLKHATSRLSRSTVEQYEETLRTILVPRFGGQYLDEISPSEISVFLDELFVQRNYKMHTIKKIRAVLSAVFTVAEREAKVKFNPVRRSQSPRAREGEFPDRRIYSDFDARIILAESVGTILDLFVHIALYLGPRKGEILGLEWNDLDTVTRILKIRRSRVHVRTPMFKTGLTRSCETVPLKTRASKRDIEIPIEVLESFQRYLRKQSLSRLRAGSSWITSDSVFINEIGEPELPHTMSLRFKRLVKQLGIEYISPHGMRRTVITSMANLDGANLPAVSRLAGHSSIKTTTDIYVADIPDQVRKVTELRASLLRDPLPPTQDPKAKLRLIRGGG